MEGGGWEWSVSLDKNAKEMESVRDSLNAIR
jgi:hypothetical protein